jgi:hypothetical protein
MGFASNASPTDDTYDGFHAVGLFGPPAGRTATAPDPNPRGLDNAWGRLHDDSRVRAALGRNASMSPGGWRALPDQVAVGLVNLLEDGYATQRLLPTSISTRDISSPWFAAAAFAGWSSGPGGAAPRFRRFEGNLARAGLDSRWTAYVKSLVDDYAAGRITSHDACTHGNAAFSAVRTAQKLQAGKALAERTGGNVGWFDVGPPAVLQYLTVVGSQNAA